MIRRVGARVQLQRRTAGYTHEGYASLGRHAEVPTWATLRPTGYLNPPAPVPIGQADRTRHRVFNQTSATVCLRGGVPRPFRYHRGLASACDRRAGVCATQETRYGLTEHHARMPLP